MKKGLKGRRKDAYVYGTMRRTGWKPKAEAMARAIEKGDK